MRLSERDRIIAGFSESELTEFVRIGGVVTDEAAAEREFRAGTVEEQINVLRATVGAKKREIAKAMFDLACVESKLRTLKSRLRSTHSLDELERKRSDWRDAKRAKAKSDRFRRKLRKQRRLERDAGAGGRPLVAAGRVREAGGAAVVRLAPAGVGRKGAARRDGQRAA